MTTQDIPKPVTAVLEKGLCIRQFKVGQDDQVFLDTYTPWDQDDELVQEICHNKHLVQEFFEQLADEALKDVSCRTWFVFGAAMIGGKLTLAGCLLPEAQEVAGRDKHRRALWHCRCDCGYEIKKQRKRYE
jgi:hypothetical protein